MTGLPEAFGNINEVNITVLHTSLVPDCNKSARYEEFVLQYTRSLHGHLSSESSVVLDQFLHGLAQCAVSSRSAAIAVFEAEHPGLFLRLYGDLLTHFYSTPEAAERVRVLAHSAPREASPYFDPSLLNAVIQHQPGKRRL